MFIVTALFPIAKRRRQPRCPLTYEQVNIWSGRTTECYSALKRKAVLTRAAAWANLEAVMLSELNPSQKEKCYTIPLT